MSAPTPSAIPDPTQLGTTVAQAAGAAATPNQSDPRFASTQLNQDAARGSAPTPPPLEGKQLFGEYELLEEIARGGMGVVYKARQIDLNRIVALKMILAGKLAGPEEVQRFHTEAKAAAQLHHPNIVAIYEVGEIGGQHFFSMEYVPGKTLAALTHDGALPGKVASAYLEDAAHGLHYAHQCGILHRDLKPANIMLDDKGRPKITDFGLAKVMPATNPGLKLRASNEVTKTGIVMGTPSYMAPEQAQGQTRDLTAACDVYGLGAVLYELITGRPPFKAESHLETILQVLNQDPVPPRLLNRNVDADLETICLKCLEKDPTHRYPDAESLAQDLRRYQDDEPITARSFNLLDRLTRALTHSAHDKELRSWGLMLMLFGLVIFAAHLGTSLLLHFTDWDRTAGPPNVYFTIPRLIQFALLGVIFWHWRPRTLLPTNPAERLLWAVWGGYLIAYVFGVWIMEELGHLNHLSAYPVATLLSGLAFFIMGCHVWGLCYLIGLAFMFAAPYMARYLKESEWSPACFGALWALALLTVGLRYWRISQELAGQKAG